MSLRANYFLNLAALATGRQPTRPLLFSYYVTHRCPMNCHYCAVGAANPYCASAPAELSTSEAMRLIAILAKSSETLDITGGEPMLRSDLEALLIHARNNGMHTVLNTKGIGLANRPDLMRTDTLVLSVDSLHPEKLAELYGCHPQLADEVLDALDVAMTMRSEYKTQIVLSTVATPANLGDIAEILALAERYGFGFHVSPQIVEGRANPGLRGNTEYIKLINTAITRKRSGCAVLGTRGYLEGIRDLRPFRCYPLLMPMIGPDGRMAYPCIEKPVAQVSVLEAGSYPEALRAARRMRRKPSPCPPDCHLYCYMALGQLQRRPIAAMREGRHWAAIQTDVTPKAKS